MKMLFHRCNVNPGLLAIAVMVLFLAGLALLTATGHDGSPERVVSEYDKFSAGKPVLNLPPALCQEPDEINVNRSDLCRVLNLPPAWRQDPGSPSEDAAAVRQAGEMAPAAKTALPGAAAPPVQEDSAGEQLVVAAVNRSTERNLPSRGEDDEQAVIMQGLASWYGGSDGLDGRRTAYGEIFDADAFTAAHRELPYQTMLKVTFLKTGKSVIVRVNDRGPVMKERLIDLSRAAAAEIGLLPYGVGLVEIEVLR